MNLDEFEIQARDIVEQTLNQLQSATLLVAELEAKISEAGQSTQTLGQLIEQFVFDQRNRSSAED